MAEALDHPEILLYLRAAKHFSDNYREQLEQNTTLTELEGKAFWRGWETDYLLGNLIDTSRLKKEVLATCIELQSRFGSFEY